MKKKVLITGISGFAGSHLAEYVCSHTSNTVFGTYLSEESLTNLSAIKDKVTLSRVDLAQKNDTKKVIAEIAPDIVFHLAALSSAAGSFDDPLTTITNNIAAQVYVLEAVKKSKLDARILIVSSAEVYGRVDAKDLPIDEETSFRPTNPYAVSKLAQDFLGLQYYYSYGMQIIRVRPFNHIGPRQSPDFVVSAFAKKIAEIEKGKRNPVLPVGNLEPKRDFTDVRDMVRAYFEAVQKGTAGDVYNIGSGKSFPISFVLEKLLSFTTSKIRVEVDGELFRPSDIPQFLCDYGKFHRISDWKPKIAIEQSLKDTLDYWRNIV